MLRSCKAENFLVCHSFTPYVPISVNYACGVTSHCKSSGDATGPVEITERATTSVSAAEPPLGPPAGRWS